jgi:hypothetical protein
MERQVHWFEASSYRLKFELHDAQAEPLVQVTQET